MSMYKDKEKKSKKLEMKKLIRTKIGGPRENVILEALLIMYDVLHVPHIFEEWKKFRELT